MTLMTTNGSNGSNPAPLFLRGDRVLCVSNGQTAIVEGHKDGNVLLLWGVSNTQPERSWRPASDLRLQHHGDPYTPTPKKEA